MKPQQFFPAKFYTDPELIPQEKQSIFKKSWLYVGDRAQ